MFRFNNIKRVNPLINVRWLSSKNDDIISKTLSFIPRSIDLLDQKLTNLEQQTSELNRRTEDARRLSEQNSNKFNELFDIVNKNKHTQQKIKEKEKGLENKFQDFGERLNNSDEVYSLQIIELQKNIKELRHDVDELHNINNRNKKMVEHQLQKEQEERDYMMEMIPLLIKLAIKPDVETTTKLVKMGVDISKDEHVKKQLQSINIPDVSIPKINIPSLPGIGFNNFNKK